MVMRPKSKLARHIDLVVVIRVIAIVVLASLWAVLGGGFGRMGGGGGIFPSQHTVNIVHGPITVGANSYSNYTFTVPFFALEASVSGSFTASGGSGNNIKVYIMNQTNFTNWVYGHQSYAYYISGLETSGTINASLPGWGTYYLVYDNTFSYGVPKNVQTTVNLTYASYFP